MLLLISEAIEWSVTSSTVADGLRSGGDLLISEVAVGVVTGGGAGSVVEAGLPEGSASSDGDTFMGETMLGTSLESTEKIKGGRGSVKVGAGSAGCWLDALGEIFAVGMT